jgi:hypothetical protein
MSAHYGRPCAYALSNQADAALESLAKAIDSDEACRGLTKEDQDFDGLRGDERFEAPIAEGEGHE